MTPRLRLLVFLLSLCSTVFAQKTAYIPLYLQNTNDVNGAQFTWSKTQQSANFTLIWGNTVGTNPANYPDPDLSFNPVAILDTMEYIYAAFKGLGFLDDAAGTNLSQYKIPIVVYNTWGPNGAMGWANGGDADGVIGAFWVHPNALDDGGVAAHELAHSLQAQCNIDYRAAHGLGYVWLNAGIFWETHANFMRNLLYPKAVSAWGMDVYHTETWGDWKNTYENYELLLAIMESEGIDMVNRLWRESFSGEYPLQAYKRLAGYDQARFNDSLFLYARRMATFNFNYNNIGKFFRQYRAADLSNYLPSIQATYSILKKVPGAENRYEIPIEVAPEEFAYNVIPLYPENDSCAVIIKFKGHTETNTHTGWRYGFVAANANGIVTRYSPTYSDNTGEINFRLEGNETRLFLVVMGAPFDQITTNTSNDTWHGYPKHFRYPYELNISGAKPEGFQAPANFRSQLKFNGHLHANGGGWVQNSANVAASVYVGPSAMVLGNANITGQVRIENTALVRNATISGQVQILDNAFVDRGNYSGNAVIRGQGFAENVTMSNNALIGMRAKVTNYNLSGTVEVGGDVVVYNENGSCNNGVHYRLTNYYDNKLLECDGRTANHPANKDVNNTYALFSNEAMDAQCQCASQMVVDSIVVSGVSCSPGANSGVQFFISHSCGPFLYAWSKDNESGTNLSGLTSGNYTFSITDALGRVIVYPVEIPSAPVLAATLSTTAYDCTNGSGGVANVAVAGGSGPYHYAWNNGATDASVAGLTPGLYAVTATDALGCTFSDSVQVELSGELNTSLIVNPISCHDDTDGSAVLTALNGTAPFAWLWQGGETDSLLTNLGPGDYAISIFDAFGCMDQQQFSLIAPEALDLTMEGPTYHCPQQQGIVSAIVTGGISPYQYNWSNSLSDAVITIIGTGTYTVTITDSHGCTILNELEIVSEVPLDLTLSTTPIYCFDSADGTASVQALNGTSPFQWNWSNGQSDSLITNLVDGSYAVTVTDAHSCSNVLYFNMSAPPPINVQAFSQPVQCYGDSNGMVTLFVGGGIPIYSYLWSNQETANPLTNLSPGSYSVTVTDMNGCSATEQVLVESPEAVGIIADVQQASSSITSDGAIFVTDVSGGVSPYTFLWSNGATTQALENILPGEYNLSITDTAGCVWIFSFTVSFETAVGDLAEPVFSAVLAPNPSVGACNLWLEVQQAQELEISISDTYGRVLYKELDFFQVGKGVRRLPEGFAAGVYWVRVTDGLGNSNVLCWIIL